MIVCHFHPNIYSKFYWVLRSFMLNWIMIWVVMQPNFWQTLYSIKNQNFSKEGEEFRGGGAAVVWGENNSEAWWKIYILIVLLRTYLVDFRMAQKQHLVNLKDFGVIREQVPHFCNVYSNQNAVFLTFENQPSIRLK